MLISFARQFSLMSKTFSERVLLARKAPRAFAVGTGEAVRHAAVVDRQHRAATEQVVSKDRAASTRAAGSPRMACHRNAADGSLQRRSRRSDPEARAPYRVPVAAAVECSHGDGRCLHVRHHRAGTRTSPPQDRGLRKSLRADERRLFLPAPYRKELTWILIRVAYRLLHSPNKTEQEKHE